MTTDETAKVTEREITRVNARLVAALRRRATARKRLVEAEHDVLELRRHLRMVLRSVLLEPEQQGDQSKDADAETVLGELLRDDEQQ
jgi:hypothetical protein